METINAPSSDQFYLVVGNEQKGPYSSNEIKGFLKEGNIGLETLYWKEGMADWMPLRHMSYLAQEATVPQIPNFQSSANQTKTSPGYRSERIGFILLAVPVVASFFNWVLADSPLIGVVTVIGTAVLIAIDAKQLGVGSPTELTSKNKREMGPVHWLVCTIFLWVIAFPAYLHKRSRYHARGLLLPGICVTLLFCFSSILKSPAPTAGPGIAENNPPTIVEPPQTQHRPATDHSVSNSDNRAISCAKTLVLKNLRAPSTATFVEASILYKQHPWYQVYVVADAQNGFGAYLRNGYLCTIMLGDGNEFSYKPVAGIQQMDEGMIQLEGVLEGIRAANDWPGTHNDSELGK